ncbi:MAG: alanine dehydrogenase [Candidatus Bathyarchaeota archaeon]|nr:alanine dehydrogenase [Candidatus Bathyarchaeota archaeon]
MKVLLLSEQEVAELLSIEEVMKVVENAFREKALGYVQMPPKVYLNFSKYNGDIRAMPAYLERLDTASVKIVNSHPENPRKFGLPTVLATVLLLDPKSGSLLSLMGGNSITAMRTAAAAGIATKYLANRNSKTASFIGAGVQARAQLLALLLVVPNLEEIRICDISLKAAEAFAREAKSKVAQCRVEVVRNEAEAVRGANIVITTTPSKKPLIFDSWVSEGTHFNCVGADAPLKEELDPAILKRAKIVVDDWEQAAHSGEINVPMSKGILSEKDVWAELGDIVAGTKPARISEQEITIFDSTGLAIQDAATVELVYKKAISRKAGCFINI